MLTTNTLALKFHIRNLDTRNMMIFVSVSSLSKHNMSTPASSSMDTNRKTLPKPDEALRSAHPQCEEEGLKCSPSSSDVVIAAEEIGEGFGRTCLSTPSDNITFTTLNQGHMTCTSKVSSDVPPMTTSHFRPQTRVLDMHIESSIDSIFPTDN